MYTLYDIIFVVYAYTVYRVISPVNIIQKMNGYECNGTDIFMRLEMECSIQRGKAELNRTFHLTE